MDLEQLAQYFNLNIASLTIYAGLVTVLVSSVLKAAQAISDTFYARRFPGRAAPSIRKPIGTWTALVLSLLFGLVYTMPWVADQVVAGWLSALVAVAFVFATATGSYEYFSGLIGKFGKAIAAGQALGIDVEGFLEEKVGAGKAPEKKSRKTGKK